MRRSSRFSWLSLTLLAILLPGLAWGQYLPLAGPGPIAPAPDSAPLSAETHEPPPPRGYAEDIWKAKQAAASVLGVAPGHLQYDRGVPTGKGSG